VFKVGCIVFVIPVVIASLSHASGSTNVPNPD
jgi:hypothetical protein